MYFRKSSCVPPITPHINSLIYPYLLDNSFFIRALRTIRRVVPSPRGVTACLVPRSEIVPATLIQGNLFQDLFLLDLFQYLPASVPSYPHVDEEAFDDRGGEHSNNYDVAGA
jgi:hypothetical protein